MAANKVKADKKKFVTKNSEKLPRLRLSRAEAEELPKEVPVLGPQDIFIGGYSNSRHTKFCLLGHVNKLVTGDPNLDVCVAGQRIARETFANAIVKASEHFLGAPVCSDCFYSIDVINDDVCPKVTRKLGLPANSLHARIWNLGMALLGYTVNNPEAKYVKTK